MNISTRLNDPLAIGRTILDFELSADGTTVLYRADQDNNRQVRGLNFSSINHYSH